jgi:hypothetical protein
MIKREKVKPPKAYPLYVFRTNKKAGIARELNALKKLYNPPADEGKYKPVTKMQLLEEALEIGFKELKRRRS